ncbi:hypothetical protein BKA80DRAFT_258987, partial [Phyllosticta citrichinensis]
MTCCCNLQMLLWRTRLFFPVAFPLSLLCTALPVCGVLRRQSWNPLDFVTSSSQTTHPLPLLSSIPQNPLHRAPPRPIRLPPATVMAGLSPAGLLALYRRLQTKPNQTKPKQSIC